MTPRFPFLALLNHLRKFQSLSSWSFFVSHPAFLLLKSIYGRALGRLHAARNESGERREPKGTSLLYRQADACRSSVVARMTIPLGHGLGPMPW